MQLFDLVNDNFFALLTSKHKKIYCDSILILLNELSKGSEVGIRKEIISAHLYDYFKSQLADDKIYDDQDHLIEIKEFSSFLLRKLKECGWIDEEIDNNYQRKIYFTRYGFRFASLINDLLSLNQGDDYVPEIDYQNYIYTIYLYLRDYKSFEGKIVIEKVYKEMDELRNLLKELSSSIKTYIERSLKQKELDQILYLHFDEYKDTIGNSYHLLKTSDNVAKFKGAIIDLLDQLIHDEDYIKETITALIKDTEILDKQFFLNLIHKKTNAVLTFFNYEMDIIIKDIDSRHAEYIRSTINRFKYLSNNSQNIEGQINTILKHLVSGIQNGDYHEADNSVPLLENLISINTINFIDEKSFYTPRAKNPVFTPTKIEVSQVDMGDSLQKIFQRIAKRQNKQKAEITADNYLLDNTSRSGRTIDIDNDEDLLSLINLMIYGKSINVGYSIELLNEYIKTKFINFKDFEIRRK